MEIIKLLLAKEREYVSQFVKRANKLSDTEVDRMFDKLIKEQEKKERIKKKKR